MTLNNKIKLSFIIYVAVMFIIVLIADDCVGHDIPTYWYLIVTALYPIITYLLVLCIKKITYGQRRTKIK